MLSNERDSTPLAKTGQRGQTQHANQVKLQDYFQLQFGIVLALPRVNACCSEPSASMVQI